VTRLLKKKVAQTCQNVSNQLTHKFYWVTQMWPTIKPRWLPTKMTQSWLN